MPLGRSSKKPSGAVLSKIVVEFTAGTKSRKHLQQFHQHLCKKNAKSGLGKFPAAKSNIFFFIPAMFEFTHMT